jgi:HAD superfamily hydrolase (TIGR01509 family)
LVIFDCDGVLVDSEPITCAVMAELVSEIGLAKTAEQCMHDYVGLWWPDCMALIEAELGRPLPAGFTKRFRKRQSIALAREVGPVAGVVEALERIDVPTCVASNGPPEKMAITLGAAGLLDRFEGRIFSADEVDRGKPAPDLYIHAAQTLGHERGECAVVEDSPLGVEAALAAGMAAYGYSPHGDDGRLRAAGAVTFDSMEELPGLLARGH